MSPKIKKLLQYGFFLALGVALMIWQYQKMTNEEKDTFLASIKSSNYIYLFPVIAMSLISHLSRAIRWRFLINSLGYTPKLSNTFATVMIGYLVNTLLPRAGEVAKCTMLSKKEEIPPEKLLGTIIIERAIDLACFVGLIIITIILQYESIKDFVASKYNEAVAKSSIHPGLKAFIYLSIVVGLVFLFKYLYKKNKHNTIFKKVNYAMLGLTEGVQSIKKLQNKKAFWLHTLLIWTMYLLQIYVGFSAMSFTAALGINVATAILSMGSLAMILTPGGIGAFPVAVGEVLQLYGSTAPQGLAFGWVIWGVSTSIIIIFGLLCFIWFEKTKKSKHAV